VVVVEDAVENPVENHVNHVENHANPVEKERKVAVEDVAVK